MHRLQELFGRIDVPKAQFAEGIMSQTMLTNTLNGNRALTVKEVELFAEKYDVDPIWLAGFADTDTFAQTIARIQEREAELDRLYEQLKSKEYALELYGSTPISKWSRTTPKAIVDDEK